jgi:hypothetical protein
MIYIIVLVRDERRHQGFGGFDDHLEDVVIGELLFLHYLFNPEHFQRSHWGDRLVAEFGLLAYASVNWKLTTLTPQYQFHHDQTSDFVTLEIAIRHEYQWASYISQGGLRACMYVELV